MIRSVGTFVAVSFAALSLVACSQLSAPQTVATPELQTQTLGTAASDRADDLAVNQKLQAVFLTGTTNGALDGPKGGEQSLPNIFVRRYTRSGGVVWRKHLDTGYRDFGASVASDPSGNVVVVGYQQRPGELSYISKGLLYKFSGSGTLLWSRLFQVEVGGRLTDTEVRAVAADVAGNIYVAGDTDIDTNNTDPGATFVRKYSSGGTVLWSRVFNAKEIFPYADELALDASGNAYVLSHINSDGYDLPKNEPTYLTKVSASGQLLFHKRFSSAEAPSYLQVVGNTLYVSGIKRYFNAKGDVFETDALFAAYDLNGTKRWDKTFGTRVYAYGRAVR